MYAAAGGASLASRQARQRQRQQNNKNKVLQQQAKLAQAKTSGVITPTRAQQSRQFHQLPSSYLRTPQTESRKLSATQSKLLLPIVEGNNQQPQSLCQPHHQQFEPYTRPVSPRPSIRPNDPRTYQFLTKSATATLPLNSQTADCTPPATPIISVTNSGPKFGGDCRINDPSQYAAAAYSHILPVPQDSIIVTPATPLTSPGHRVAASGGPEQPGTLQLERKCSFYRVRRSDAFEYDGSPTAGPTTTNQAQNQADPHLNDGICYGLPNGGSGHKWAQHATYCAYCEDGSYICDHVECAQGRAAWLERGRRCSVQDSNPASCHRRWVKRNRIQDSSLGGSSDDEDLLGVLRGPSSFANAFLYVGLGTIAIGLVIAFVGTGEKGFKTVELRLIGPSLIGIGLICCILRICFCICPSHCLSSSKRARKKNSNKIDADHTTSLLRGESKRVSIAKGPHQKFALTHKSRSNSKMINEGMEALRQIATTSLFLQNEQKPSTNRIVPIIKEPEKSAEAPLEMKKLDTTLNICDITDDEDDDDDCAEPFHSSSYHNQNESLVLTHSKLARQRLPTNQSPQQHQQKPQDSETLLMETSLMIVNPMPSTSSSSRANIVHSPPPIPSSSQGLDLPLPKSNRHQQHMPAPMVHTPPPGTSSGYLQQPRVGLHPGAYPSIQAHHSRNPPPLLSSSGSYSAPNPNKTTQTVTIVEPELVLSPAKLGQ